MNNIIVAEGLGKRYGHFRALKDVSFSVRAGECFGFLGHNGAGKSTTINAIVGVTRKIYQILVFVVWMPFRYDLKNAQLFFFGYFSFRRCQKIYLV